MDSSKLAVKFFVDDPSRVAVTDFVPVFHRWIQTRALPQHQLIDVADYKHVHEGPGLVLVSHEANIHADLGGGQLGLLYFRKQPLPGTFASRLREVFRFTLTAAAMLEREPSLSGRVNFRTDEVIFRIHDRLLAPNEPRVFDQLRPQVEGFVRELYRSPSVELRPRGQADEVFEIQIRTDNPKNVSTLVEQIG